MTHDAQSSFNAAAFPDFTVLPPGPPIFNPQSGAWLACSYADVQRVLHEHSTFSNERPSSLSERTDPPPTWMVRRLAYQSMGTQYR